MSSALVQCQAGLSVPTAVKTAANICHAAIEDSEQDALIKHVNTPLFNNGASGAVTRQRATWTTMPGCQANACVLVYRRENQKGFSVTRLCYRSTFHVQIVEQGACVRYPTCELSTRQCDEWRMMLRTL